uniref:Domain of unknown function DB domain-containing protein n=1 Tax=Globodera rostochiensis TaxID=31243 RepID=A0A914H399_GLORO
MDNFVGLVVLLLLIANAATILAHQYEFSQIFRHSSNAISSQSKDDLESQKSIQCCIDEAGLPAECAKSVCNYFNVKKYPDSCTVPIMHNFVKIVACFTAHKDNTECCKSKGVQAPCVDLCNGKNPDILPDPEYVPCTFPGKVDTAIQQCNHDAWTGNKN